MSSIRYALLSLLAREPLSGYDIKQYMNNRLGPFWKVGSNQVYPELSKLEGEGLVKLQGVEQNTYRPARKLYEITEAGREALIEWTIQPLEIEHSVRDEFLLKTYNSWLVEPEKMVERIEEIKRQHEERLAVYLDKADLLKRSLETSARDNPLASSLSVLQFGIRYERMYIEWCDDLLKKF